MTPSTTPSTTPSMTTVMTTVLEKSEDTTPEASSPAPPKALTPQDVAVLQGCTNPYCQCVRRDNQMAKVPALVAARLAAFRRREQRAQQELKARALVKSTDAAVKKTAKEAAAVSRKEETPLRAVLPALTAIQSPQQLRAVPPKAAMVPSSTTARLPRRLEPIRPTMLTSNKRLVMPRRTSYAPPPPPRVIRHKVVAAVKFLDPKAWQRYGNFARQKRKMEAEWDYPHGNDVGRVARPAKRSKNNPSNRVPTTIRTNDSSVRRISESDMTATSELTAQSIDDAAVQDLLTTLTTPTPEAIPTEEATHIVSLASRKPPPPSVRFALSPEPRLRLRVHGSALL
jgi:hypothetical protein